MLNSLLYYNVFRQKIKLFLRKRSNYHTFIDKFESEIKTGVLKDDTIQRKIASALNLLDQSLVKVEKQGFLQKIMGKNDNISNKGMYIYGSVGSGKTMLMNMFYDSCSVKAKKRIHFHEFMIEVHKKMHEVKSQNPLRSLKSKSHPCDPIPIVAEMVCRNCRLLCFDEFQVTDIADAMILKRLFESIFKSGIFIIATSNRHPDDLYKHGLQRANFLPCIALVKKHCEIHCLDSKIDYRKLILPSSTQNLYFTSKNCLNPTEELQSMFRKITNDAETAETTLTVFGRKVYFKKTVDHILYASFSELCQQPLSAADYIEISKYFHTVFMENIPQIKISQRNRLRRFITMIDSFYDNKIRFICSSEKEPEQLFITSDSANNNNLANSNDKRLLMDDLGLTDSDATHSIFTDEEEQFAHRRTISRLIEMRTRRYWDSSNHRLLSEITQ